MRLLVVSHKRKVALLGVLAVFLLGCQLYSDLRVLHLDATASPTITVKPVDLHPKFFQGIWQETPSMAAGWADRYHFYPSGTFHFYPNQMVCRTRKVEKSGSWQVEDGVLTLSITKQVIFSLEVQPSGSCIVLEKEEIILAEPGIEKYAIFDYNTREGDIYPSISLNDVMFWKFSNDASSYGDETFSE